MKTKPIFNKENIKQVRIAKSASEETIELFKKSFPEDKIVYIDFVDPNHWEIITIEDKRK